MSKVFIFLSLSAIVLSVIFTFDAFCCVRHAILSYLPFTLTPGSAPKARLFTKDELSKFTGTGDSNRIYLAVLGEVFDVTKGKKHYGKGGGYHFFAGKDGTRAFVSGDFTDKGLIEDISGLTHTDILGIDDWKSFYHKDYKYKGKLIGLFYDENGDPTDQLKEYYVKLKEATNAKTADEDDHKRFPTCNFAYNQGEGRRIWCSTLSGGVQRDWVGLPRQYFQPGKTEPRCACLKNRGDHSDGTPNSKNNGDLDNQLMKVYEGCDSTAYECSGGVQRDWVGLPRQYFQPGKTEPRCACVKNSGDHSDGTPNSKNNGDLDNQLMKVYDGCDPTAYECRFNPFPNDKILG